jgi:hypothetical protein
LSKRERSSFPKPVLCSKLPNRKETVYETGIGNLTEDETTVLVHFGKDRTQQWTLIRLQEQPDQK